VPYHSSMRNAPLRLQLASRAVCTLVQPPLPLWYNDHYQVSLPSTSSFPMEKYRYIREALQRELEAAGKATFHESPLASVEDLTTVHDGEYVRRYLANELSHKENRRIGFPWSEAGKLRALSSTGGTVAAMHAVCRPGGARFAGHIAGGTHHAFADRGEGYCVFNDIAVAAACALRDYTAIRRVLLIDLDVHQVCSAAADCNGSHRSPLRASSPSGGGTLRSAPKRQTWHTPNE